MVLPALCGAECWWKVEAVLEAKLFVLYKSDRNRVQKLILA